MDGKICLNTYKQIFFLLLPKTKRLYSPSSEIYTVLPSWYGIGLEKLWYPNLKDFRSFLFFCLTWFWIFMPQNCSNIFAKNPPYAVKSHNFHWFITQFLRSLCADLFVRSGFSRCNLETISIKIFYLR